VVLVRSGRLALGYRNARIREIAGAEHDAVLLAGSMDAGRISACSYASVTGAVVMRTGDPFTPLLDLDLDLGRLLPTERVPACPSSASG
jgi:hypothetical protein